MMTVEEWPLCTEPLELLEVVMDVESEHSLWNYVVFCLEGVGEIRTANLIRDLCSGAHIGKDATVHIDEEIVRTHRAELERLANRRSGGGYSMGRKPVHMSMATQRARAGLAALLPEPCDVFVEVTRETQHLLRRQQCAWLRCRYSNRFQPVAFNPSWRTSTAVAVAKGMYDSRDFAAMPLLADSLQDAGCADDRILDHCRGPGPHVKGCWVVDLVLGKE